MQRESPTDATVTVNPSMTTSVAVVPDTSPERGSGVELQARLQTVLCVIGVAVALTLALEIDVGLDKAGDERARQRLQPVVAADVRRQRAHDVLEQMLLAVERRRHAVVAVEHLARQIQAAEGRQIRGRSSKGERGRGGTYGEDGEGGCGVPGDAEAVGLDEEVVLAALGEAGVAVAQGRALGAPRAELAADECGQGQRRRQAPLPRGGRHRRPVPVVAFRLYLAPTDRLGLG
jgi:hypothetical protein